MAPNLGKPAIIEDISSNGDISIILTPISDQESLPEVSFVDEPGQETDIDVILLPEEANHISLEQNLGQLLVKITDTEDLTTVTQLKLRVISREVTLQYLNIYTPALRELTLDGSVIASLRDLGDGLKNLKILRANRCELACIDGVFGLENLEELYAADNAISSLAPCAFLTHLNILDVRRNFVHERNITYLKLCENLNELYLEGNPRMEIYTIYTERLRVILPQLKKLNGFTLIPTGDENSVEADGSIQNSSPRIGRLYHRNLASGNEREFSVQFPPRVFHT
ncbi:unnamed protein product [Phaedon cochleariae]|uniref:Uncharacterized protein n=1 Tax=Phaedon cochleariae TaxID=80249 RepID=A0A9N9SKG5_PHACE|nr:unnamed protein product [Phaedon cochleariae]